jgi:hypothetical protein
MTIGDMAALLWPAAVLRPAAPPPDSDSSEAQPLLAKAMWRQPDSPRIISWVDNTAFSQQQQEHLQAHREIHGQQVYELDRQRKQHQMMQQPVHGWGLASSMEVR